MASKRTALSSFSLNAGKKVLTLQAPMRHARPSCTEVAKYDVCQDLVAYTLATSLRDVRSAEILIGGAGCTTLEIIAMGML
jgi:hypothetical protein